MEWWHVYELVELSEGSELEWSEMELIEEKNYNDVFSGICMCKNTNSCFSLIYIR